MNNPDIPWKKLSSRTAYQNPWYRIREDKVIRPDGKEGVYGVLETSHAAYLVPVDSEGRLLLIRQYRYPTEMWSWELPAGGMDGQDPLVAAKRELGEELGLTARNWQKVAALQSLNGISSEIMYVFVAKDLEPTSDKRAEEGIVETKKVTPTEFEAMIASGEMSCAQSIAAFTVARPHLH